MSQDARIGAWLNAWERIQALQKFKLEHAPNMDSELPEGYWGVVVEAQILATLATADTLVGVTVGELLQEREKQEIELANQAERLHAKMEAKKRAKEREDPSCTCSFDDSQCPIHSQGDDIVTDEPDEIVDQPADIVDDEEGLSDGPSQ